MSLTNRFKAINRYVKAWSKINPKIAVNARSYCNPECGYYYTVYFFVYYYTVVCADYTMYQEYRKVSNYS